MSEFRIVIKPAKLEEHEVMRVFDGWSRTVLLPEGQAAEFYRQLRNRFEVKEKTGK